MEEVYIIILLLLLAVLLCVLWNMHTQLRVLRKADRMKRTFLNNICHEIRAPLKSVAELAILFTKEGVCLSKTEKRDMADQLQYNSNLIGTLLDEVLIFTDESSVDRPLNIKQFSPNALCRRCLEANLHSIFRRQAVKLNFKRELSDEFFVKSDRHLLEVILNKLILNACRFTEQGEVLVGCNTTEQPGKLTIFVSDTGVGIPENRVRRLFSWFDDPDDMKDEAELDLSICQKLAGKLGGILRMDSMQQKGTRMLLILPL